MKYNVKVFLNRIPPEYRIMEDFEHARLYFLKHGIEVTFSFNNIDISGYKSVFDATKNRWRLQGLNVPLDPLADVNMFIFDENEWATPQGLRKDTPSGDCSVPQIPYARPLITLGAYSVDHSLGITWVGIYHELMHSLVQNSLLKGTFINDVMDTYRENNNPDSPTGNFAEQWKLLEPVLRPYNVLQATLTRLYDYGRETVGKLTIESLGFECNTLELGYKDNQTNVSSIKPGTYKCEWRFMPSRLAYHYQILAVPQRSGVYFHSANWYSQLLGCVAVGKGYANLNDDLLPDILNSKKTLQELETLLAKRSFLLTIK